MLWKAAASSRRRCSSPSTCSTVIAPSRTVKAIQSKYGREVIPIRSRSRGVVIRGGRPGSGKAYTGRATKWQGPRLLSRRVGRRRGRGARGAHRMIAEQDGSDGTYLEGASAPTFRKGLKAAVGRALCPVFALPAKHRRPAVDGRTGRPLPEPGGARSRRMSAARSSSCRLHRMHRSSPTSSRPSGPYTGRITLLRVPGGVAPTPPSTTQL
jgi:hypothetical protein